MIKRTLFFGSPGYLHCELSQLVYESYLQQNEKLKKTMPIEDLGFVIIESPQITITTACIQTLAENNTAIVFCNASHMPGSLLLPMSGHTLSQKHIEAQLSATDALKGRLWKQTVSRKILNQGKCLIRGHREGGDLLKKLSEKVKNGDPENVEARAAKIYFKSHFPLGGFTRERFGEMPNSPLNYGYAILRAAMARALIGSGLTCLTGIHHCNQYNSYVLADDIMEPYRPFVDDLILNDNPLFASTKDSVLTKEMKANILSLLTLDVMIDNMRRPLMNALSYTTASLVRCFLKEENLISYPMFPQ